MPNPDVRLLALDGGGVRGLSALMILEQLMDAVNPDAPPKPCDYFDMIGGTSTGGVADGLAIMLGRLKMSIDECIHAYLQLSDRIFQKKRHRATVKGKIQGRFDSDELERAVKEVIKGQGLQEDALLKDTPDASCKVFVCATSKETSETVCLTSYKSPRGNNDLLNSVKIWEACRATSAASSFFDPIAIGRYNEEFVDGATGANNPVVELWNQAQLMWGPAPLEGKVQCLVSIGTGIPSLKPFRDDLLHIGETLVAIATETEQTAERFRRDKAYLDSSNRYFRFNVVRGLEDIGLEQSTMRKEIAAATRRYVASQDVFKQMQACAGNLASREYVGEYRTNFSLEGIPRVKTFVERPSEMAELERALLPQRQNMRQKIFVLYGLGGIGKTQLALEFTRRHHRKFSSVFWLDGSSEVSLKLSIARCAGRIPASQISDASRTYSISSARNIDEVVGEVIGWLAQPDNTEWLVVFDNVDRDYSAHTASGSAIPATSTSTQRYPTVHGTNLTTSYVPLPYQAEL
ncbi:FabD/lysophospholipase-like protein [Zopfia rhizophila CBS 207.26]|uniref:FabD/lysophospholipase-like protein n=1 Tax=Zopfia rhizophila CBS 207.26 TaxID=1314779 RepID=A0A6A6EK28_9PEZI|nr:FabD/lysophospholipase-like protein [Zopfia rhizophila CBS 207.26]